MSNSSTIAPAEGMTVGLDVGDREASAAMVNAKGKVMEEVRLKVTEPALRAYFSRKPRCRVVMEAGTHSPWVKRLLVSLRHEVMVLNPHRVRLIAESRQKTDRIDALTLAELGRIGTHLAQNVAHRDEQTQLDLALLRSRAIAVQTRTKLINHIRSSVKTAGGRIGKCRAETFHRRAQQDIPETLQDALLPLVLQVADLSHHVQAYDRKIAELIAARYPEALRLMQVPGVGPVTALTFVLTLEWPGRFRKNRQVGKYLGLAPGIRQSGRRRQFLGITREGDRELRRLMLQASHSILVHASADGDLRRWALAKGAANKVAKKKAAVALARKLAVLMLALWRSGEEYRPFRVPTEEVRA